MADEIRYKKPFMSNGEHLGEIGPSDEDQLYVFPCYMRPGRQNYIVVNEEDLACSPKEEVAMPTDASFYYIHKCLVENRQEEVINWGKPMKSAVKERKFKHELSPFGGWKPDTSALLDKILEHDF